MSEFDIVNTITAFHRLAKAPDRQRIPRDSRLSALQLQLLKFFVDSKIQKTPQCVANSAWAVAKLDLKDQKLMDAIAAEALKTINDLRPQDLSITAWSYATLRIANSTLLHAISAAAIATLSHFRP